MNNPQNRGPLNPATPRFSSPFPAVRINEFRNLLFGRFVFIIALRMMTTLVGWWVYQLTNTAFAIGLVGLSEVIPAVSFALYAGHVIDISEKRWMLMRGVLLYLAAAGTLLFLSTAFTSQHLANRWIAVCIYAVIFCTGIIRSFTGPVFNVILAHIVPRTVLQNATTWSQGTWLTASVTGRALGGLLIAYVGITGALGAIVTTIFACIHFTVENKAETCIE